MWFERLKELKARSGMTTKEIAAGSGIPEPTLVKLFAGVTKEPKLNTIQQLVHFLGYTLDDLDDVDAPKSPADFSDDEKQLIEDYRKLTKDGQMYIRQTMAMAVQTFAGKNKAAPDMEAAQ